MGSDLELEVGLCWWFADAAAHSAAARAASAHVWRHLGVVQQAVSYMHRSCSCSLFCSQSLRLRPLHGSNKPLYGR